MLKHFNIKQFIYFSLLVMVTAILGIIIHELGHYISGKLMGFTPTLHYGNVTFENDNFFQHIDYHKMNDKLYNEIQAVKIIWSVWGPLTNIIIGLIGFIIIIIYNKRKTMREINLINLISLLISLLLLRQIINYLIIFTFQLVYQKHPFSDELIVDNLFKLPTDTTLLITAIISVLIFSIILFYFVPKIQRLTFLCSVGVGGFVGSVLWLFILGPIILP